MLRKHLLFYGWLPLPCIGSDEAGQRAADHSWDDESLLKALFDSQITKLNYLLEFLQSVSLTPGC